MSCYRLVQYHQRRRRWLHMSYVHLLNPEANRTVSMATSTTRKQQVTRNNQQLADNYKVISQ